VAVVTATVGSAPRATAQVQGDDGFGPTRGVFIPGRSVAGEADATALELNPGQLALLTDSSLVLVGDQSSSGGALPGRGVGLLFGARLWSRNTFGIGVQGMGVTPGPGGAARTKLQLAYGLGLGRSAGLGASWNHIFRSAYAGVDSFDIGASWRLARQVALGAVVQDVNQPRDLRRAWTGELVIRPLGSDRLELAAGAVHVDGHPWRAVTPRFRLMARVADGLRPFAELETVPGVQGSAFASAADRRVTAGVWVDFDHLGGGAAVRSLHTSAAGGDAWGGSFLVRVSGDRFAPLVDVRHVEKVSVGKVRSDRDFLALVTRLRAIAADGAVAGVVLKIESLDLGLARIEEIRDLLADLRARGKAVFAYVIYPATREMYLASACDRILIHPAGSVAMSGLSQDVTFYKEAMDRLGIDVDLVRIAEFKGAMEPFILNRQSEPVRDNKNRLLDDVFNRLVTALYEGRRRAGGTAATLSEGKIREMIDHGVFLPREAESAGLIDAIRDEGEVATYVGQVLGHPGIAIHDPDPSPPHPQRWRGRRLAVVLVDGTIVDAASQQLPFGLGSLAGADTLVQALDRCKNDPSIAAVVLRVNSPGGSAFASDVIARAITRVRAAGKPVIVSMGDYAASGGYYIAAPANAIFAEPSTITGSIGIFAFKADVGKVLATLGVSVETFRRGAHADLLSPYRRWTDDEKTLIAGQIRHLYDLFLATVENGRKGRGITAARADALGRGQVWTGAQGLTLGLVDRSGGLIAAIDHAAGLTHLRADGGGLPELVVWPRPRSTLVERAIGIGAGALAADGGAEAGEESAPLTPAELAAGLFAGSVGQSSWRAALRLLAPLMTGGGDGLQARLPFDLEFR
jgi:protease-4